MFLIIGVASLFNSLLGILHSGDDRLYQVLSVLGKGGLFIIDFSFIPKDSNNFLGITKNYIDIIPINIV